MWGVTVGEHEGGAATIWGRHWREESSDKGFKKLVQIATICFMRCYWWNTARSLPSRPFLDPIMCVTFPSSRGEGASLPITAAIHRDVYVFMGGAYLLVWLTIEFCHSVLLIYFIDLFAVFSLTVPGEKLIMTFSI